MPLSKLVVSVFPPIVENLKFILLLREYGLPLFEIYMPFGDSYKLTRDNTFRYLMRLKMCEIDVNAVLDYLWNFRAVVLSIDEGTFVGVSEEELRSLSKEGVLSEKTHGQVA